MKRFLALFVVGLGHAAASACCGVAPIGQAVSFGDQSNIIVWNSQTKTEHFVRNAHFDSKAKDFGFIASTPTMPTLSEANEHVYDLLESCKPRGAGLGIGCSAGDASMAAASAKSVEVLQQVDVGKYQATTVRSDDPRAMLAYLKENGYATRPDSDEWIKFYTGKKWVFTAFKVRASNGHNPQTGIIRMSFKTDEPFNPYYVPTGNSVEGGTLKVYFVADGSYSATIGHGAHWNAALWQAPLPESTINQLTKSLKLSLGTLPMNLTVTYFEKAGWLEGAKDDLYFTKDSNVAMWPIAGLLALGGGLWWFTKSRKDKIFPLA
jgi:hypothetical protein